jgi:hypothetical protein
MDQNKSLIHLVLCKNKCTKPAIETRMQQQPAAFCCQLGSATMNAY